MFLSITLLNILLFSSVFASSIRDFNGNELRLGEVSVHLPAVNPSSLNADVRNMLYTARRFASKYDEKLANVQRRINLGKRQAGENMLLNDVEKFRYDFVKDYNEVKNQLDSLNRPSILLRRNIMDASLMSRLNEFMQLLGKLPAQITCLIFDCTIESSVSPTYATTVIADVTEPESYEVVEEI